MEEENSYNPAGYQLPSELLSDHTHSLPASENHQLPTEFPYDFASFTCSPEHNQEDDFFAGLTRQFALSTLLDSNKLHYAAASQTEKKWRLSSSPQSILSPGFSNGSPTGSLQGPSSPTGPLASTDHSWDLIREAVGQVNCWTMLKNRQALGTHRPPMCFANNSTQYRSSSPHPCLFNDIQVKGNCGSIWAGLQTCPKGAGGCSCCYGPNAMRGNPEGLFNANGFGGDGTLLFSCGRKNILGSEYGGVERKCAGTGVFLPRRGPDPVNSRPKSGRSAGMAQQRAADVIEAEARFLEAANIMAMRRNAALAQQWRHEVKMKAAMNNVTHLPNEYQSL